MCELLVTRSDPQYKGSIRVDVKRYRRGSVPMVRPDGWKWGKDERGLPLFRIIKCPVVDVSAMRHLEGPDFPGPNKLARRTVMSLDLDALEALAETRLGRRLEPQEELILLQADIDAHTYRFADVAPTDSLEKLPERAKWRRN